MRVSSNNVFDHAPGDIVDYGLTYASLLDDDETISNSEWGVDSADISLSSKQTNGATTSVFAGGGVKGTLYVLTNTVETSAGRKFNRVIVLSCKQL